MGVFQEGKSMLLEVRLLHESFESLLSIVPYLLRDLQGKNPRSEAERISTDIAHPEGCKDFPSHQQNE